MMMMTNCTKLTLSLRIIDGGGDNDDGHDDDNNNSAIKGD